MGLHLSYLKMWVFKKNSYANRFVLCWSLILPPNDIIFGRLSHRVDIFRLTLPFALSVKSAFTPRVFGVKDVAQCIEMQLKCRVSAVWWHKMDVIGQHTKISAHNCPMFRWCCFRSLDFQGRNLLFCHNFWKSWPLNTPSLYILCKNHFREMVITYLLHAIPFPSPRLRRESRLLWSWREDFYDMRLLINGGRGVVKLIDKFVCSLPQRLSLFFLKKLGLDFNRNINA